jgi:glycerol-3-phosphate acyltransferase PlsY
MCGFLFLFGAYLIGSIPTGLIVARLAGGTDPRSQGSGNIGATNVGRVLGRGAGLITLAGDVLKGAAGPLLAGWVVAGSPDAPAFMALAGAGAVMGHIYPLFLGLKGGKGVATAAGVFLVLSPLSLSIAAAVFALLVWRWRYVSLGSIGAALALPVGVLATGGEPAYAFLAGGVAALVVTRHRENITRLRQGREMRLGQRAAGAPNDKAV